MLLRWTFLGILLEEFSRSSDWVLATDITADYGVRRAFLYINIASHATIPIHVSSYNHNENNYTLIMIR